MSNTPQKENLILEKFLMYGDCEDMLRCPCCKEGYLHHTKIEVFQRNQEDDDDGWKIVVEGHEVKTVHANVSEDAGNPSSRRDGLRIFLYCEMCDAEAALLNISQHKGGTYLSVQRMCRCSKD